MTASAEARAELLLLLSEAGAPSGRFTEAELDYMLDKAVDIYSAAALGWRMKADKLIASGGLVQSITTGSEAFKFASISETLAYCEARAKQYEAQSTAIPAGASLVLDTDVDGGIGLELE